ncbi:hypothetical protein J1N35_016393 [Gossypium stocksii]|uniref:Uncharacterized protein n=1 Tax=Gossypium stocksii TaxID=47602 RepID=A0A9D3VK36_9ROSI|nr:hypothetical protein J1N35_016393 [Gossypium stocksii]
MLEVGSCSNDLMSYYVRSCPVFARSVFRAFETKIPLISVIGIYLFASSMRTVMYGLGFQPARVAMMFPRLLLQVFLIVVIHYCCFCCFRCFNVRNPFWGPATTLRQL